MNPEATSEPRPSGAVAPGSPTSAGHGPAATSVARRDRALAPGDTRAAGGTTAGADRMEALARRAAQVRRDRATSDGRPADWANPDVHALRGLPEQQHPVHRALNRSKEGKTRSDFASMLRRTCEMLAGAEPRSMSLEDVFAYPWHLIDESRAEEFRRAVYRRHQNQGSRNDMVCAVRRVVDECHRRRLISPLRRQVLFEALYTVAPGRSRRRRRLTPDETRALLTAAQAQDPPARAARDTAMVALIRATGMRGCELAGIDLGDWDRLDASIWIRDRKNGRDLLVFLPPAVLPYLDAWLQARGERPGALFTPMKGPDKSRPLTVYGVRWILKQVATAAGVTWMGSHDFRRSFATDMLELFDPVLVSDLMGHEKVDSTRIYDQRGDDALRAAVGEVPLPPLDTILEAAAETATPRGKEAAA